VTGTPVGKKPPAARPGAAGTDPPPNGGHKSGSPDGNGHGKDPAAQPGSPSGNAPRKANRRGAARLAAVQALYQMDMTGAGLNEILAQFESHWLGREVEGEQYLPAEAAFFRDIVSGVVDVQRDLDPRIDAALEATWPLKRIEAILRSVLRAGAYELQKRTDVPARVVVSEYVDVAHAFVDKTETGMVNAVLDRLARNVRAAEFG
jgi:N utilization substance protein B